VGASNGTVCKSGSNAESRCGLAKRYDVSNSIAYLIPSDLARIVKLNEMMVENE